MKFFFILSIFLVSSFISCIENSEPAEPEEKFTETEAIKIVAEMNTNVILDINKAFRINSAVNAVLEVEEGTKIWSLSMKKPDSKDRYIIDLGMADEFDFPAEIKDASITFLKDQVIIDDLNSDFVLNFFIQRTELVVNKAEKLPPVYGKFLRVSTLGSG